MNTKFSFILFIIISQFSYSQNYIQYYNLSNQADSLKYYKKYEEASKKYEEAFSKVNFVHSDRYVKAGITAINLKNFVLANKYFEIALTQSGNKSFYKMSEFKKNKKEFQNLIKNHQTLENKFLENGNKLYRRKIDSLYFIDQNSRNNKTATQEKDHSLFNNLVQLIATNGFPSEELVGIETYNKAKIILHHNLRLDKNQNLLKEYFTKYVETGNYRPEDYAWVVEQNRIWFNNQKPLYYYVSSTKVLSDLEKLEINRKRKKIGLKPIEAYKETKNTSELLW